MGNTDSKAGFRKAILDLKSKDKVVDVENELFWQQFWKEQSVSIQDVFTVFTSDDIRSIRQHSPQNFSTLAFKCVDQIRKCVETSCSTAAERQSVLNCARLLTRLVPFFLEDGDFRNFFWSQLPTTGEKGRQYGPFGRFSTGGEESSSNIRNLDGPTLAVTLMSSLSSLLFCPNFTVYQHKKSTEESEDLNSIDSCEYIWEAGVGFSVSPTHNALFDQARIELLRLLLTCFSETIYSTQANDGLIAPNRWLEFFTSADNRHVLPLFTSLLNVVFAYDPVGYGLPYNYMIFGDTKEPLVEVASQVLLVCLDHTWSKSRNKSREQETESAILKNMFINYLSRIHRDEDFTFVTNGFVRLLNNPLQHSYLPSSTKKIQFHQELLILFWKCCDYNKRFMYHVLKSSVVLDILVPILHSLNESKQHPGKVGFVHMGIFILLLLSGERNFGVRLNKPFTSRPLLDLPAFTGNHADLIILVFHRLVTSGHSKLQPLFDCLLTIILNISAYVKSLSAITASKLIHLFEAFSTPWFLFANATNYHLVFLLLETFNNLIQYQFDGNVPLVYAIIRKRAIFHQLANLPLDNTYIDKAVSSRRVVPTTPASPAEESSVKMVRSPDSDVSLHATLPILPSVSKMTGKTTTANLEGLSEDSRELPSVSGASSDDVFDGSSVIEAETAKNYNLAVLNKSAKMDAWRDLSRSISVASADLSTWTPTTEWAQAWKSRLPLHCIMRLLQVLVPQVEKICIDKNITEEAEILKFLQRGTLVGLLPVPHPIIIQKYQSNAGTSNWLRSYMWGIICVRNKDPPVWFDTKVTMFEIQSS